MSNNNVPDQRCSLIMEMYNISKHFYTADGWMPFQEYGSHLSNDGRVIMKGSVQ